MISKTSNILKGKKEFKTIDITKFICSLLVVTIHVSIYPMTNNTIILYGRYFVTQYLARLAVPFFFICSGFFLFRKMDEQSIDFKIVWNYIKKILLLYVIWSILYLPLSYLNGSFNGKKSFVYDCFRYIWRLFFKGSYFHFWYFPALIFAIVFVALLLRAKAPIETILSIGGVLYVIGLLLQPQPYHNLLIPLEKNISWIGTIYDLYIKFFFTSRNGLFEGAFFVSLGAYFAYRPYKFTIKKSAILFGVSMLLMLAEVFVLTKIGFTSGADMYLFLPGVAFFMFGTLASIRIERDSSVFMTLRSLSTIIYVVHMWANRVLVMLVDMVRNHIGLNVATIPFLMYSLTVLLSIAIGLVLIRLAKVKGLGWIKKGIG